MHLSILARMGLAPGRDVLEEESGTRTGRLCYWKRSSMSQGRKRNVTQRIMWRLRCQDSPNLGVLWMDVIELGRKSCKTAL